MFPLTYFPNGNIVNLSRTSRIQSLFWMNWKKAIKLTDQKTLQRFRETPKPPFTWGMWTSHLIHQCQGRLHSPSRMPARSFHTLLHKYATKSQWLQWNSPYATPKLSLHVGQLPTPATYLILGSSKPNIQTPSRSNQPFSHNAPDRQTYWLTNWQMVQVTKCVLTPTYALLIV